MKPETGAGVDNRWFEEWFDSPLYPILYSNRDEAEAEMFLTNLVGFISPDAGARILDVACGRGRHARYLADRGFDITGIDLSEKSITEAKLNSRDNLKFMIQDMRCELFENEFDLVLNLFTSFGYFTSDEENMRVLRCMKKSLRKNKLLVLDFLNVATILPELPIHEEKILGSHRFLIEKFFSGGFIRKKIMYSAEGIEQEFHEQVKAYTRAMLESMLHDCGFAITHFFGDYHLNKFNEEISPRLILLCRTETD